MELKVCSLKKSNIYISDSKYLIDNVQYVEVDRPYDELTSTYFNFIEALKCAKAHGITNAAVYSASRVIDELNGIVSPVNESFHRAMMQQILPYFVDIEFYKISEEELQTTIAKAGDIVVRPDEGEVTPEEHRRKYQELQRKSAKLRKKKFKRSFRQ